MSIGAQSNRSQFPALFGPAQLAQLKLLVTQIGAMPNSIRASLFRQRNTTNSIYRSQDVLDVALAQEIAEGSQYQFSRPEQGLGKTFEPVKKGGGVSITQEMAEDSEYDLMGVWARKLNEAMLTSREIDAANVFNNAFSSELGQDGAAYISASHPVGELTYSNVIDSNPDLSITSLNSALAMFEKRFVKSNGGIITLLPKIVVVSSENKRYAKELVESQYKPDNNYNNINAVKDDNLMVVSSPYFTDPDAWFLMAAPVETGPMIVERQGLRAATSGFNEGLGFTTDSALIKASYREDIGCTNSYGILGSSGS